MGNQLLFGVLALIIALIILLALAKPLIRYSERWSIIRGCNKLLAHSVN